MQVAPVDDQGTKLSYLDSGPVAGDTYTTLVCIHGHTYHAQNFRRMVASAAKYNLRVVAPNRRDYPGSTPLSHQELDALNHGGAEAHTAFLRARGYEIARFLAWFIEEHKIPSASADGTTGGLALLGWSAGNITTLAFLRHVSSYPSELIKALEPYLRTLFIYDVSNGSLGYPSPPGSYHPLLDPTIPERMRGIMFGTWVSSYYKHPDPTSRTLSGLQLHIPEAPHRLSTNETIDPADLLACVDPAAGKRAETAFYGTVVPATLNEQTHGALFDTELAKIFPELKVRMVYAKESIWSIQVGVWEIEKDIERWKDEGVKSRPLKIIPIEGANHFFHWEDAERALETFSNGIRN